MASDVRVLTRDWIKAEDAATYAGKWVAVLNTRVLVSGASLAEVAAAVGRGREEAHAVFLVPEHPADRRIY